MVDWDRVEKLRSKGVDWDDIAADPKVSYTAPEGVEDSGRALKALYYSRKSKGSTKKAKSQEEEKPPFVTRLKKATVPIGIVVVIIGLIWFVCAYEYSLISVFLPAFPDVLLVAAAGGIIAGVGIVLGTSDSIGTIWKKPVAVGIVLALILVGSMALVSSSLGIPNLNPLTVAEPGGWQSSSPRNPLWQDNNLPVAFFYGSIACPYCSASSWALWQALGAFGNLAGIQYGTSNPADVYPNTPEVEFVSASFSSNYIALDVKECDVDSSTSAGCPSLSLYEQDYVNAYDSAGSIPFYVVGGYFVHVGTTVDPATLEGLTVTDMQNIMANPSQNPTVYNAVHQQTLYWEAFMVKADQLAGITPPSTVTDNSAVMDIVASIT